MVVQEVNGEEQKISNMTPIEAGVREVQEKTEEDGASTEDIGNAWVERGDSPRLKYLGLKKSGKKFEHK